ncbi:MAG: hypothetical protein A2W31_08715 [Planctomycetes bacterium RBG_16_64_10]|nr:MAG: hypothetical protein A2W31_08715 [Planctomycetes bacterium RBG_16_64_10]
MHEPAIQLISYIAPAAPATRRPADGTEPSIRPEIGFTPAWFRQNLPLDFGHRWHTDPAYRRQAVLAMRGELRRRFPQTQIGRIDRPDAPLDLLTGTFGACTVAAIYGVPIRYAEDNWPNCEHQYLSAADIDRLEPADLDTNPFFHELMTQVDWIAQQEGRVEGYINWQGVLNNAQRLRGQELLTDLFDHPDRVRHLLDCIATTMIDAAKRLHQRQRQTGVDVGFFTVSNCLVNMVSPAQYAELLLPFDRRIAEAFDGIGVHNCAWTADPYLDHYATLPQVAYIDMGKASDLRRARRTFPAARRAIMYTPMDLANLSRAEIHADFSRIAREYGPCDIVLADIEVGTPDDRIMAALEICAELTEQTGSGLIVFDALPIVT